MTEVTTQLLEYPYRHTEAKGVPDAIQIARQWLEEILKKPWLPDESVRPLVHHGDGSSCDAVKFTYRASDADGPLTITVYQSLFLIVVTVASEAARKPSALEVAHRLFNYIERLNLTVEPRSTAGLTGRQVSSGVPYRDYDWLDTIQWWSDEKLVGFEMLKRTGRGQGTIVRPELEGNRAWFARFE